MAVILVAAMIPAGTSVLVTAVLLAAAAYADSQIIMPMFMDEPDDSPSFGSWDVAYAEEGSPMKYAYGSQVRVPGQLIMAGHPYSTQSGGGGGKRAEPVQHTFWTDVAMAILTNKHYRIDRIDIEGNPSYVRDNDPQVIESYQTALTTARYRAGPTESTVVWHERDNGNWDLVQWHMTITNELPYERPDLAAFIPGELLRITTFEPSTGNFVTNNSFPEHWHTTGQKMRRTLIPTGVEVDAYYRPPNSWRNLRCISSRNHGHVQAINALGESVSVLQSKLVIDVLGDKAGALGMTTQDMVIPHLTSGGVASGYPETHFMQNAPTAAKNAFDPDGRHSPFNYQTGHPNFGWPRSIGSGWSIRIEYDDPRLWTKDVLRKGNPVAGVDYTEHYGGAETFVDPIYEAQVGTEDVPALPGLGYMALAGLNLSRFGNRIPHMHFYVDASERKYVGAAGVVSLALSATEANDPDVYQGAIETILKRHANFRDDQFDVHSKVLNPFDIVGMSFGGLHNLVKLISSVALAADIHVQEWGGKLRFMTRDQRPVVNASWQMMDARQSGSPPSQLLSITDQDLRTVPRRVHLKFQDYDKDMQPGDIYAYRDSSQSRWTQVPTGDTEPIQTRRVQIPDLVMTSEQARPIAERIMSDIHEGRKRVTLRLPSWFQNVTEGDVIKLSDYEITSGHKGQTDPHTGASKYQSRDWWIVVNNVDIGADFYIEVEGIIKADDPRVFSLAASTAPVGAGFNNNRLDRNSAAKAKLGANPPSILVAVDIPPLLDAHAGKTGVYLAYCVPGAVNGESGGNLFEDVGDGDSWINIGRASQTAVMARVIGELPDGPVNVEDTTTNLVVELLATDEGAGGLSGTTDAGLAQGANLAAIGGPGNWEIIQFKTATEEVVTDYVTSGRYRLTDLRRGLRGTERFTNTHNASELFVLLDHRRMHFHEFDNNLVGMTRRYMVAHSIDAGSRSTAVTIKGYSSLSLPVASLVAWRKSNGDIVFTWKRRTRARYRTFGTQSAPLMEGTESYDVVIDLGSDRTINVTDATTATYTAAMQSTDSTSGLEITATVYQRDSVRGRGQPSVMVVAQTQNEVGTEGDVLGTEDGHTLNTPLGGGMD